MKQVYLDIVGWMHSLYNTFILYPPPGYEFVRGHTTLVGTTLKLKPLFSFQQNYLSRIVPLNLAKAYLERFKKIPPSVDLTFSAGHLVFRKEPWVVHIETVTELTGYQVNHFLRYKKLVEKLLGSEYCKKIICWSEAGRETVLTNLDIPDIEETVVTLYLAVPRKDFVKRNNNGKIKILFVGSANLPGSFEIKGGKEVIEAFVQLNKKYHNLELVVRSNMPKHIRNNYKGIGNIKIIDGIIPRELLEQEFTSADIFLFPSHITPGMVILEAMSYELPVITTDVWANPELVKDGETGFIVKKSSTLEHYYEENFISNWGTPQFMKAIQNVQTDVVEQLVEKTSILIEDEELRKRMGKIGRQEIESGKFSIDKRNKKLKRIFDEATG